MKKYSEKRFQQTRYHACDHEIIFQEKVVSRKGDLRCASLRREHREQARASTQVQYLLLTIEDIRTPLPPFQNRLQNKSYKKPAKHLQNCSNWETLNGNRISGCLQHGAGFKCGKHAGHSFRQPFP